MQTFEYDTLDRLESASATGGTNGAYTNETYTYDADTGNLETKGALTLQYGNTNHKHAVTSAGGNNYTYDANGNMITRDINSGPLTGDYVLSYDAENRLTGVTKDSTSMASFVYDGDGRQVKATINGVTTTYVGAHYEITGTSITKYYFAGGQRVALRKDGVLNYLLGDHLGSSSITTDANGISTAQMLYKAWGEMRYSTGSLNTKYEFTGQRNESALGLRFYNARWYDDALGRFIQADSIVPGGAQGLDRYAYVNNSPAMYVDPSGHCTVGGFWMSDDSSACQWNNPNPSTLDDFRNLSWQQRKNWIQSFTEKNDLGDWFNDIGGAIDFMSADSYFSRVGSTTEVMDAAVLQAINDGWLIHTGQDPVGGGGQGWADFFDLLKPSNGNPSSASQQQLNIARLRAEQMGVDYAYNLPDVQTAISNASTYEQIYFADFKFWADSYRTLGINGGGILCPICVGNIDPRKTGGILMGLSNLLPYEANLEYSWLVSLSPMGAP